MTVFTLVSNCEFAKFWRFTNERLVFQRISIMINWVYWVIQFYWIIDKVEYPPIDNLSK